MNNATSFKSNSSKSNAKRFLTATCKIEAADVDAYLTQVDNKWGTYLDKAGKPVRITAPKAAVAVVAASVEPVAAVVVPAAVVATEVEASASTEASAFGAFAMSQLTAATNAAPAPVAASPAREGATSTTGLKVQKDRPEQNGVRRMSQGTVGDRLWTLFDTVGPALTLAEARTLAEANNLSPTSASIAIYSWRKFHAIASRNTKG